MIVVLGEPRTGTSMMMQTLILLGADPVGERFLDCHDRTGNPRGYWESLAHIRGDALDEVRPGQCVKVRLRYALERSRQMPRGAHVILTTRAPSAAAHSFCRLFCDGDQAQALRLSDAVRLCYARASEIAPNALPVRFADMVRDPGEQIRRICRYTGLAGDRDAAVRNVRV